MDIREYMKDHLLFLDGGTGTLFQKSGMKSGEQSEAWNLSHPEIVSGFARQYYEAGSNVVLTNTFGVNSLKYSEEQMQEMISAAIALTKKARSEAQAKEMASGIQNPHPMWVGLDIGPTGKLLKPLGDLDFEEAVSIFSKTIQIGVSCGVDLIMIETMNDSYETKAALLAAKENSDLPVFVSNVYGSDLRTMNGTSPQAMIAMLEGMGADAIGMNCSLGPKALFPVVEAYLRYASVPVLLKPNAGMPVVRDGKTEYDVLEDEFAEDVIAMIKAGVRVAGGCCGTTPEYIAALTKGAASLEPVALTKKNLTHVSSYTHAVAFGQGTLLIGERINPTGKKRFKKALLENDIPYILNEGIRQEEAGVHLLDVNVGLPGIDEPAVLDQVVFELQGVTDLPLQIDTSDPIAMEKALRHYNGKALVNSVNGKIENMEAIFPLVQKYGGTVICLTLDENGIPETAQGRLEIAERIVNKAAEYGIEPKDLVFDTLTMTISAMPQAANVTLDALRMIREKLGCHTSLGVSNVSFGLPERETINSNFFAMAIDRGLSAAIMNPFSAAMMRTYFTSMALKGYDNQCMNYLQYVEEHPVAVATESAGKAVSADPAGARKETGKEEGSPLTHAITKGLKDEAARLASGMLKDTDPLVLIQEHVIPALNQVGEKFEKKIVYLPQLLMSAEAASAAFGMVKEAMASQPTSGETENKCEFVLATVKGDIHDIGKNIVHLLMENYGFSVHDLGKDVDPEAIVEKVVELHAPLCGLSALMTTTVPAMEETIRQLKEKAPWCKTIVGGAVLTQSYADQIGADFYSKDAMETVRYSLPFKEQM